MEDKKRSLQSLTKLEQHDPTIISIFVGCLLGDASAIRSKTKTGALKNTIIKFAQSGIHYDYLCSLKDLLATRGYTNTNELTIQNFIDKRGQKIYTMTRFATYSFVSLNELHTLFYRPATEEDRANGRGNERFIKKIPNTINEYLNAQALAHWYMDDGSFHIYHGTGLLATHAFSNEDLDLLQTALYSQLNIKTNRHKGTKKKEQFALYIPKGEFASFAQQIKPYMHQSMYYKLGLDVNEQPLSLRKTVIDLSSISLINLNSKKPALRLDSLSPMFKSVCVGLSLGSGSIERKNKASALRFYYTSDTIEYAKLLHKFLVNHGWCKPNALFIKTRTIKKTSFQFIRFNSLSFSALNQIYDLFYDVEKKKRLPTDLETLLTDVCLGFWVMERGILKGCQLHLQIFEKEETRLFNLKKVLKKNFNLDCEYKTSKKALTTFIFTEESTKEFEKLVRPHLFIDVFKKI